MEDRYMWMYEVPLLDLGENLTSIQVHRLNDYRVGICGSSEMGNAWMISDRTYVNQAVKPELLQIDFSTDTLISAVPVDWGLDQTFMGTALQFEDPSEPQQVFTIEYEHDLTTRNQGIDYKPYFTVSGTTATISSVEVVDSKKIVIAMSQPITYSSSGNLKFSIVFEGGRTDWALQLALRNGYRHLMYSQEWSWTFIRPITEKQVDGGFETLVLDTSANINFKSTLIGEKPI